jgi:hypothetical protein
MFIEYGIGVSKSYGNLTYGVSYTIGMTLIIYHTKHILRILIKQLTIVVK